MIESFPALAAVVAIRHGFVLRHPSIDVIGKRDEVLQRLQPHFKESIEAICGESGMGSMRYAEQVHGAELCQLHSPIEGRAATAPVPGVDGLLTDDPEVVLGIYVADCCAVYLVDPKRPAIGLVHSGKKGTEAGIVRRAIERMRLHFHSSPADLVVQLSPCIRPPAYEVDIPSAIKQQCLDAGVPLEQIHDSGVCTTSRTDRYYSYRTEQGKTGRMLALLGLTSNNRQSA